MLQLCSFMEIQMGKLLAVFWNVCSETDVFKWHFFDAAQVTVVYTFYFSNQHTVVILEYTDI